MSPGPGFEPIGTEVPADPLTWGHETLARHLADRGLPPEMADAFKVHLINGEMGSTLVADDLSAMGIAHPLHQRRILCEMRSLFGTAPPTTSAPSCLPEQSAMAAPVDRTQHLQQAHDLPASQQCQSTIRPQQSMYYPPQQPPMPKPPNVRPLVGIEGAGFQQTEPVAADARPPNPPPPRLTTPRSSAAPPSAMERRAMQRAGLLEATKPTRSASRAGLGAAGAGASSSVFSTRNDSVADFTAGYASQSQYFSAAQKCYTRGPTRPNRPHSATAAPGRRRPGPSPGPNKAYGTSSLSRSPSASTRSISMQRSLSTSRYASVPDVTASIAAAAAAVGRPQSARRDDVVYPPQWRPSRGDDWLPSGPLSARRAPSFPPAQAATEESSTVLRAEMSKDALQLASDLAGLPCEEAEPLDADEAQEEPQEDQENNGGTAYPMEPVEEVADNDRSMLLAEASCSSRLAEVSRDRVALQSELSKVKQDLLQKAAARDRQLARVKTERDELLRRLRNAQRHCEATSRENRKLRGRLAEALAWSLWSNGANGENSEDPNGCQQNKSTAQGVPCHQGDAQSKDNFVLDDDASVVLKCPIFADAGQPAHASPLLLAPALG